MDRGRHEDEPPVVDISVLHRREWRRLELARRRRVRRQRLVGGALGLVLLCAMGVGASLHLGGDDESSPLSASSGAPAGAATDAASPVRVELDPVPVVPDPPSQGSPASAGSGPGSDRPASGGRDSSSGGSSAEDPGSPGATPNESPSGGASAPRSGAPVVWVQAGHADPREPGYRDQTGASSGPFGSEIGFTTTLAPKVVVKLRAAGIDARETPGEVTPLGAPGAVFLSLHHDIPQGTAAIGHAVTGAGENYYHGEGSGTPSPTPYPDSAPHRRATTVSAEVESRSRALATAIAARYGRIHTAANGAAGRFTGVQTPSSNPRVMHYYGFYRTGADARVIVEAGAGGTDDAFLAKTDLIASALAQGVLDHLRARGLLPG